MRIKCLTCRTLMNPDKRIAHKEKFGHSNFIEFEGELKPTQQWSDSLYQDEIAGLKTMKIKISTHKAITEISSTKEAATFDDIILAALGSYKREQEIGPQTLESIVTNEEEE